LEFLGKEHNLMLEVLSQWGTEILEQIEEVSYATPSFQLHLVEKNILIAGLTI